MGQVILDDIQFHLDFKQRLTGQTCFQSGSLLYAEKMSTGHFFFAQCVQVG